MNEIPSTDMRIVSLGSGGAILDLNWFLSYGDTRLVKQALEIEGKDDLLPYCKHFSFLAASNLRSSQKMRQQWHHKFKQLLKMRQIYGPQHYGSSFSCYCFCASRASRASKYSHVCPSTKVKSVK
jgi:hypothetical protein